MPLSETVLVLMALLATGIAASGLFRHLPIPHTIVLVLIGMALSYLSRLWQPLQPLQHFHLTPDLVLFIFLPALIFESGLNLNARQLVKDIAPVLLLAVPALLFSTAVVGLCLWLVLPVELHVALLFGALISATDPVAVISLFKELGTPVRLTVLVEGESLLNDATAIVVVSILLGLASMSGTPAEIAIEAAAQFLLVFFGGALVGVIFGFFISWLMSRFAQETSAVLILSLVLAYMSFVIAEHSLHVSGVMAVVACAIILGIFGITRLPQETVEVMHETWGFIAQICNTLLFLFIGMLVDLGSLLSNGAIILFAVFLVQASRASMIYSLVPLAVKVFKLPHVTTGERHIMFWGGLKGGLALAIVLALPVDLPGREILINLTLGVVLFTLLINAPTIRPLIRKLGIDKLTDDERAEVKRSLVQAHHSSEHLLTRFLHYGLLSRANQHLIKEKTDNTLSQWIPEVIGDDDFRHQRLSALRSESKELDDLFRDGVLKQYVYLDLRSELQRKRDYIITEHRIGSSTQSTRKSSLLLRMEDTLVKWLREKDWAAGILSEYQNKRMSSHLMRDIARILMSEAALTYISREESINKVHRNSLEQLYNGHLEFFRQQLNDTRNSFPEFFERFETNLCSHAALIAVRQSIETAFHQGSLTSKVYSWLEHRLQQAINKLPPITEKVTGLLPEELIEMVPLFAGLPEIVKHRISKLAIPVNYLEADTIIGSGEHGGALYIIMRGRASVLINKDSILKPVREMGAGDFFGEIALLGDHVRTANVHAITACTLLRIPAEDVLDLGKEFPEITEQLNKAKLERSSSIPKPPGLESI